MADRFPKATATIMVIAGAIGGLALIVAPVITAFAALSVALAWSAKMAQKNALAQTLSGGSGGGLFAGKGLGGKLKGAGRFLKGKGGLIGGGLAALSIGATLFGDSKNKGAEITQDVGGIAGAVAGAAAGAALGSVVPVIGTAIGGILGSILGGLGGDFAGGKLASLFSSDKKTQIAKAAPAALAATMAMATPAMAQPSTVHQDNRASYVLHVNVDGGDPAQVKDAVHQALAEKEREHAARTRGALFDIQGG